MVEAAGVEPASESTPSRNSTCVAALESSRPTSKRGGNRGALAPECLIGALRRPARRPAGFYDIQSLPAGGVGVDVATLLSSESELRVRSYVVFHRIYEAMALGMHPASLYPRRSRVAPFRSDRPRREPHEEARSHCTMLVTPNRLT